MKSSRLRSLLLFYVGLLLLVMPLTTFHFHAGDAGKILALRHLTLSLVGLAMIVLAGVSQYFERRAEWLEDTQA
jgi:hypothetical protein